MHIRDRSSTWEVWAPAKLNLFLEVLARRADGFHEIETLMCPVDLYDTLCFTDDPAGRLELTCERRDHAGVPPLGGIPPAEAGTPAASSHPEDLPEGAENIVVRAVELLRDAAGVKRGARLRLIKRIPIAAGLGGGSSDAAAALVAANRAWRLGLAHKDLARLAARLGSDVPFFLAGRSAVCGGRGERVEPLDRLAPLHFVVVKPPQGLGTAAVYRACQPAREPCDSAPLVTALRQGRLGTAGRLLHNQLEPAAESLCGWMGRLRDEFSNQDVAGHRMSGSGTSYFGLCRHARHARRTAQRLRMRGLGRVYAVRSIG